LQLRRWERASTTGIVNVPIHQAYPLEQAPAAMNALLTHHTQGKLAVQIAQGLPPIEQRSARLRPLQA
jgi:hypothetical protein